MLPIGYEVIEESEGRIVIGMYDFLLMLRDAEPFVHWRGKKYKRGMIEFIPDWGIDRYCSCREYIEIY